MTVAHDDVRFRSPSTSDGKKIWQLVRDAGNLDLNSLYHYLLLCTHFADTMVVAEVEESCVGFVSAFVPPRQPDTVFVWQVGVDAQARGHGIGQRLLQELVERPACSPLSVMETTITPSNQASDALFRAFARRRGADVRLQPNYYSRALFGSSHHEEENLYRIAPLRQPAVAERAVAASRRSTNS